LLFSFHESATVECSADDPSYVPLIKTDPEILDFGDVFPGEMPKRRLKIINDGSAPLVIHKIIFTCGCTLSSITMSSGIHVKPDEIVDGSLGTIEPGESAQVEIDFKTSGLFGKIKRHLQIKSNDSGKEYYKVPIKINIVAPLVLQPDLINFGKVKKDSKVEKIAVIRSAGVGDFKIMKISGLPPQIKLRAEKLDEKKSDAYKLVFELDVKGYSAGPKRYKISLEVQNERVKEFTFYVFMRVISSISFHFAPLGNDGFLDFGKVGRDLGKKGTIEVINDKPCIPLHISEVRIQSRYSDFIETKIITVQESVKYRIEVNVLPGINVNYFRGDIFIYSSHTDMREKRIRFVGYARKNSEENLF